MDCFAALGLDDAATASDVKTAFRTMGRSLHPDLGGDAAEFATLRQHYDEALRVATTRPCPICAGTKQVTKTVGWTSIQLPCPTCG